ncbi:hypothetical protein [Cellulomonas sp. NS3]|uniref:hypothetical protein n=1 Tax=Cellulomonas sp. NS3 TaxID=2973977 RepID=UPI002162F674|nr:hypothetical protein [Cellulomonas sp. NS3]
MSDAPDPDDVIRCEVCGTPSEPDADDPAWLDVEVGSRAGWWYLDFCSRGHASTWFTQPLPEPDYPHTDRPDGPAPSTSTDYGWWALVASFWATIALALFGLYSLVRPFFVSVFS